MRRILRRISAENPVEYRAGSRVENRIGKHRGVWRIARRMVQQRPCGNPCAELAGNHSGNPAANLCRESAENLRRICGEPARPSEHNVVLGAGVSAPTSPSSPPAFGMTKYRPDRTESAANLCGESGGVSCGEPRGEPNWEAPGGGLENRATYGATKALRKHMRRTCREPLGQSSGKALRRTRAV